MPVVPNPPVFGANGVAPSTLLNQLRDAVNFLQRPPRCVLRQTVVQSIPTGGTGAAFAWDVHDVDTAGGHSTTTNNSRYNAQYQGWYQISGGGVYNGGGVGRRETWIRRNGVDVAASESGEHINIAGAITGPPSRTYELFLDVGDYVELIAFQDTGAAINTWNTGTGQPGAIIRWVSLS